MDDISAKAFLTNRAVKPPRLDPDSTGAKGARTPALTLSTVAGTAAYLVAPEALDISRSGSLDEATAASVALFTYFTSRMVAPHLCSTKREQKHIEAWNVARGGVAGVLAAVPIAIKIATDIFTTGGILTGLGAAGAAGVWIYNRLNRVKYCESCGEKGSCNQIVCRECLKLYFPMKKPVNCEESISLTWYALASQLQYDGLNHFEALALVEEHFSEWTPHLDGRGEATTIDCNDFSVWRDKNKKVIASFRGTVNRITPKSEQYLHNAEDDSDPIGIAPNTGPQADA